MTQRPRHRHVCSPINLGDKAAIRAKVMRVNKAVGRGGWEGEESDASGTQDSLSMGVMDPSVNWDGEEVAELEEGEGGVLRGEGHSIALPPFFIRDSPPDLRLVH